jgi:hypothetical protein
MEGTEVLKAFGDISIAFIGFSSVVAALRKSKETVWSYQEKMGLVLLGILTFGAVLLAFLPFPLYYMELEDWQIYSISAWVYVIYSVVSLAFYAHQNRKQGRTSRMPRLFNTLFAFSIVVVLLMLWLALGRISTGQLGVYLSGLFWYLILSAVQFMVFFMFLGQEALEVPHSIPLAEMSNHPAKKIGRDPDNVK